MTDRKLLVAVGPHVRSSVSTTSVMRDVLIALLPAVVASVLVFGTRALLLEAVCVAASILFEYLFRRITKRTNTISDLSAAVTGLLLAMNLPWAFGGAFFVFLIVQYMRGIPKELDEAAMIDGCSKIGILFKILVPVVQPAIVSAAIFAFYWIWQDFFQPLIFVGSPKNYTIVLIHGADDYWLINCSNIKPYAFLLDLIARCWRDGTVDAVQQSIAYTVAYYGLLHRSDVAQCLTDYAQLTVPYGPNEDDRVGDQFYNHVPRMLISQFVKDRTSPADDLRWLFDVPTLAEQSTHCAEIFQKAAENYAVYLRQCEKTAAELAEERFL